MLSNTNSFICTGLKDFKYCYLILLVLFVYISFKYSKWLNGSFWAIDGTQTNTICQGQHELGSNGNEEVLHIPQSSRLEPHPQMQFSVIYRTLLVGMSYSSAELQLVYSTAPAEWTIKYLVEWFCIHWYFYHPIMHMCILWHVGNYFWHSCASTHWFLL